jgi:hypothetical protein
MSELGVDLAAAILSHLDTCFTRPRRLKRLKRLYTLIGLYLGAFRSTGRAENALGRVTTAPFSRIP